VLSPVVSRWHPGVVVQRPAVETTIYEVPKLAPMRNTMLAFVIGSTVASTRNLAMGQGYRTFIIPLSLGVTRLPCRSMT
jgi:hypothetical protein